MVAVEEELEAVDKDTDDDGSVGFYDGYRDDDQFYADGNYYFSEDSNDSDYSS